MKRHFKYSTYFAKSLCATLLGFVMLVGCSSSSSESELLVAPQSGESDTSETDESPLVANQSIADSDETLSTAGPDSLDSNGSDEVASTPDGVTTFPTCESSATDPDGDGYGYENGKSCLVNVTSDDGDASSDGVTAFPECESSETDPDGDGYGYENEQSCLVASTDTPESTDNGESTGDSTPNPFFEDFSRPLPTYSQQDRTTEGATSNFEFGDGFAVVTVESSNDERQRGRFVPRGRFDSYSAVMAIEPGSIANGEGRVQAQVSTSLYNDTYASPPGNGDCYAGDIGVQVIMRLNSNRETSFILNAFRETQSECGISEEPPIFDGMSYLMLDTGPELGVSYRLGITIDRENKLLTLSIDDQEYSYQLLTDVFAPGSSFSSFETRVDRGPGTAIVRIEEVSVDGQAYDFTDPELLERFTFWDAGDPDTDISYVNGEIRIESASNSNNRGENRLAVTGHNTRYAKAQMMLSSESVAANNGNALLRLGGSMYYASETPGDNSSLNQVFAVTEIRLLESGATEARYCAWQSLDDAFTETISLLDMADETGCKAFALTPVIDQYYSIETWMDDNNKRIVFAIDGEEHFYNVEGPLSVSDDLFPMRIQSRANGDGSKAVVFADNLESAPSAAP